MFGVTNKHRYFRIQVIVTVVISMAMYLAAREGLLPSSHYESPLKTFGIQFFAIGLLLAGLVITYFAYGEIRLFKSVGIAVLCFVGLFAYMSAGIDYDSSGYAPQNQQNNFFFVVNILGYIVIGGIVAWLGKLVGIAALASAVVGITNGSFELLMLSPILAAFDITNIYAQWIVAIVVSVSSMLADN